MEEAPKPNPNPKQGTDLLSQVHKSHLPSAPPGFYKSLGFDFAIVVFSVLSGVVFQKFLAGQVEFFWVPAVFSVFAALSILGSFLAKNLSRRVLVIVLVTLGFLLPFLGASLDLFGISFAVMFILLFWGEFLSRGEAENSVEIRFFRMIKHPLSKVISALALVAVILYIPTWSQKSPFISEASFNSVFNFTTGMVAGLYPEYQFGSNLDDFAKSIAKGQLEKDSQFTLLPAAIKNKVLEDTSAKLLEGLSNAAGIQLNPADTFTNVAYGFLNKSLTDLKTKFGTGFVVLWAIAIFLILRSLGAILGYLVALLAFILYHAMISLHIIRVKTENKPHEVVEFF